MYIPPPPHNLLLVSTQTGYSQVRNRRAVTSSGTNATRIRHILRQEEESLGSTEPQQSGFTARNKEKGGEVGGVSGKVRREEIMETAGILTFLAGKKKLIGNGGDFRFKTTVCSSLLR